MVTVFCRNCGGEYTLVYGSPLELAWCSDECRREFEHIVAHLDAGGDLADFGLDPGSRLASEAGKEVAARRRSDIIAAREMREREVLSNRPKPMGKLYPV
jgi:hypothetical protein